MEEGGEGEGAEVQREDEEGRLLVVVAVLALP